MDVLTAKNLQKIITDCETEIRNRKSFTNAETRRMYAKIRNLAKAAGTVNDLKLITALKTSLDFLTEK